MAATQFVNEVARTMALAVHVHGRIAGIQSVSPVFANSLWLVVILFNTTTSSRTFGWQAPVADGEGKPLFAEDPEEMGMQLLLDLYDELHSAWSPADLEDDGSVIWLRR